MHAFGANLRKLQLQAKICTPPGGAMVAKINYKALRGLPRWCDRFGQYGIKVSFWASETLKIVIYVENYPQKRCFRLAYYNPLWGGGGVN